MIKIFVLSISLTLLSLISTTSFAEESAPDHFKISALLFPDTSSWTPVAKMKVPDKKYLREIEPKLRKAYFAAGFWKRWEDKDCSFIERTFSEEHSFPEGFYVHDVDSDGQTDVLYTGSVQCTEGHSTIIWYGNKDDFIVKQNDFWYIKVLGLKDGKSIQISYLVIGCCGDFIDKYYIGALEDIDKKEPINIYANTQIPAKTEKHLSFTVNTKELIIRSSPSINNAFDENLSGFYETPFFGNILLKMMPECTGKIIGSQTDKNSKLWYFIVIDNGKCRRLPTHYPYVNVEAGWVEAADILIKE